MRARRIAIGCAAGLVIAGLAGSRAAAQCILANPSFEMIGTSGLVFRGWNQFGTVGSTTIASHGFKAARVTGPDAGGWDVSAFWQPRTCSPGERWSITGRVRHPASQPLTGQNVAIVNVEWRDSAGVLLDYTSFNVATAASPTDRYLDFDLTSPPAPTGTATARLLLGVLQAPGSAVPEAWYDQVTFTSLASPTQDELQWGDFPGGRTLSFSGREWRVKGPGWYGPGFNYFTDAADRVRVDGNGWLHLTLMNSGGTWGATEVVTAGALGYGDYILTTEGDLDRIDPQSVLGIFLWEYGPCYDGGTLWWNPYNEIDIEYGRWGDPSGDIAQFVAQPYDDSGNITRFDPSFSAGEVVSHAMRWLSDRVEFRVWRGGPADESPANLVASWTYTGPHIPRPEQPRLHLNFWKLNGTPAENQEIVFRSFRFYPGTAVAAVDDGSARGIPAAPAGRLFPATPNPFNPRTTLRFELDHDDVVQFEVFDLEGRRVRTLVSGKLDAGGHTAEWNGCDDRGAGVASGVYLVQLKGSRFAETMQATLLR